MGVMLVCPEAGTQQGVRARGPCASKFSCASHHRSLVLMVGHAQLLHRAPGRLKSS